MQLMLPAALPSPKRLSTAPVGLFSDTVEAKLRATSHQPLRYVRCAIVDGSVVLTGNVPSYFLKQVAQAAVLDLNSAASIQNLIDVTTPREADGVRHG